VDDLNNVAKYTYSTSHLQYGSSGHHVLSACRTHFHRPEIHLFRVFSSSGQTLSAAWAPARTHTSWAVWRSL